MNSENPRSMVRFGGHPVVRFLVAFPIACFSGALVTDIIYAQTADMLWADFSAWLLAVGMFFGVLAAIAGIVDLIAHRRVRPLRQAWPLIVGALVVLVLGLFNNLVHSRDAWTSIVPAGLALSVITVIVMLVTVWLGSATEYPPSTGMQYSGMRQ